VVGGDSMFPTGLPQVGTEMGQQIPCEALEPREEAVPLGAS
jgi:hypothetical protein